MHTNIIFAGMLAAVGEPSYAEIGGWLLIASLVLGVYLKFRGFEKSLKGEGERREITPQPLTVQPAPQYATKEELRQLREEIDRFITEQRRANGAAVERENERREAVLGKLDEVGRSLRESVGKVHARVDAVVEKVGDLSGQLKLIRENQR
ncbi:MAG: hypothetical protein LBK76_04555 [Verrucomicrobiales bacterium]|nr:hypothetical protein [Verrucomicrobiales bacterium]